MIYPVPDKRPILITESGKLDIPHLGITFRAAMGAAIHAYPAFKQKVWTVQYRGNDIATVTLGNDFT